MEKPLYELAAMISRRVAWLETGDKVKLSDYVVLAVAVLRVLDRVIESDKRKARR
jgi:hypothetical protein